MYIWKCNPSLEQVTVPHSRQIEGSWDGAPSSLFYSRSDTWALFPLCSTASVPKACRPSTHCVVRCDYSPCLPIAFWMVASCSYWRDIGEGTNGEGARPNLPWIRTQIGSNLNQLLDTSSMNVYGSYGWCYGLWSVFNVLIFYFSRAKFVVL